MRKDPPSEIGGAAHRPRRSVDRVDVYIAALTALACGAAIAAAATHHAPSRAGIATVGVLGLLLVAAEILIVRVQHRGDVMALSLGESLLAPAIFLTGPVEATLLAVVSQVISGLWHRIGFRKTLFNVAQWSLAATTASAVFERLRAGGSATGANLAALGVAVTVLAAVNAVAFVAVIAIVQRRRIRDVAPGLVPALVTGWVLNAGFGVMFVATGVSSPGRLMLFAVPLAVLHWASRGHAAAAADASRLRRMHRALHELTTPIDPQDAIPRFLSLVRECFQSGAAELLIARDRVERFVLRSAEPASCEQFDSPGSGVAAALLGSTDVTIVDDAHPDSALESLLHAEGWRDCLAAPLHTPDGAVGVLAVYDRSGSEGFEEGELAVLQALALETAGAVQKGALVDSLLSERRTLSEVVDHTTDGIVMIDDAGTVLLWNPGIESITGYLAAEMLGTRMLAALQPRDRDGEPVRLEAASSQDEPAPAEIQVVRRDGRIRWLSCSYGRIGATEDHAASTIVVARDVTKGHELERLKEDFVATVSHELRTPLTPIKGWATTLVESGDRLAPEERMTAARSILRQADALERLVLNLLEVSRIERGIVDAADAEVAVRDAVGHAVEEARRQHPGRIVEVLAAGRCRARGDGIWIERIVANLLSNAMKFSPDGEPVEVRIAEAPGEVVVSVVDRGPGIPAPDRERIFERFHRLGDPMTRATRGTGLGLYIARQLARALGGDLVVEGDGPGSTFTLTLRAAYRLAAVG